MAENVTLTAPVAAELQPFVSDEALAFVAGLQRKFNARRLELLAARETRQRKLLDGGDLDFLEETAPIRADPDWRVAPAPADLNDRRAEITGPCDRKMVINALNSGAKVFMADLEDASSPTWHNVIDGQRNLHDAVRRTITFDNPDGRVYKLNGEIATLLVRPRGWHLNERHILVDGEAASGSL
ncbi:MAG TPA: malate synthase A, partial [Thermomicrobiales bacterium]|nr:malate synthase A [Thermomicrobiales bacterium]